MKNFKLVVELVPKTSWFTNIRSMVSAKDWDIIKKMTFGAAQHRCEICSGKGHKWPVECHEVWSYDEVKKIQRLERTIALCPDCHAVKHIGLQYAKFPSRVPRLIRHFCKVNNATQFEAEEHIKEAFSTYDTRSRFTWKVDVSWIEKRFPNMKVNKK